MAPTVAGDERWRQWWARHQRLAASPGAGVALYRMNIEIDVRHVLPTIRVPTLILHRTEDRLMDSGGARYIAGRIPTGRTSRKGKLLERAGRFSLCVQTETLPYT